MTKVASAADLKRQAAYIDRLSDQQEKLRDETRKTNKALDVAQRKLVHMARGKDPDLFEAEESRDSADDNEEAEDK